jgi:hypothetical protein
VWTTCAAADSADSPRRVSGTDEMIDSEDAVAATRKAAKMYAYVKVVASPVPRWSARRFAIV